MNKVHGYLRVSTEKQKKSFDRVLHDMKALTDALVAEGCERGEIVAEIQSAVCTRWHERPRFHYLLQVMRPGDKLIIEAPDRLDRDEWGIEMLACCRELKKRKVTLYLLSEGNRPINFDDPNEIVILQVKAIVASQEPKKTSQRTREALQQRKRDGYCYAKVPFGKCKTVLPITGKYKPYKGLAWDKRQCDLMREIVYLRDHCGWTFGAIAKRLDERNERGPAGGRWRTRRSNGQWIYTGLIKAYHLAKRFQEEGNEMFQPLPSGAIT